MKQKLIHLSLFLLVATMLVGAVSFAGSLTPPGSVANTMYSLTDIYNLSAGTTTTEGTGTIPPTPGTVASSGKTLTEVYTAISTQIALLANNKIAKDITAFGYTGTLYGDTDPTKVLTTATYAGTANVASLLKTGQTTCSVYLGGSQDPCLAGDQAFGGQDAYYSKGVALSYTDNGNNTISDNSTGLVWKKLSQGGNYLWGDALASCEADTTAGYTDWRLPNIRELLSLIDFSKYDPAVSALFGGGVYWSSTSYQIPGYLSGPTLAYYLNFSGYGTMGPIRKDNTTLGVRCVR